MEVAVMAVTSTFTCPGGGTEYESIHKFSLIVDRFISHSVTFTVMGGLVGSV